MSDTISQKTYYVYTLAYPESMGSTVFYVGKGTGDRLHTHRVIAQCPSSPGYHYKRYQIIRSIWTSGEDFVDAVVFETPIESDALFYEWILINMVHRSETLTNIIANPGHSRKSHVEVYKLPKSRRVRDVPLLATYKNFEGLRSPDGTEYREIPFLPFFCREHGLATGEMRKLLAGKVRQHKGWTRLRK